MSGAATRAHAVSTIRWPPKGGPNARARKRAIIGRSRRRLAVFPSQRCLHAQRITSSITESGVGSSHDAEESAWTTLSASPAAL